MKEILGHLTNLDIINTNWPLLVDMFADLKTTANAILNRLQKIQGKKFVRVLTMTIISFFKTCIL